MDYRLRLAYNLGQSKQTDAAVKEMQAVIQSGKVKGADAHVLLGSIYNSADPKKPAEAAIAFKKAVELDAKNAGAWLGLGRAQLLAKAYGDAVTSLQKAGELEPKLACDATLTTALVYIQMAADTKSKDLSKAKLFTDKAAACGVPAATITKLKAFIAQAEKGEADAKAAEVDDKPKGPDLATVVANLRSPNAETRRGAARQSAVFGAEAVPYLLPLINSDAALGVRTAVAKALGAIGAPAAKACGQLATEISSSGDRVVLPQDGGKKMSASEEMARINLEKDLQAACREARAKIGCK